MDEQGNVISDQAKTVQFSLQRPVNSNNISRMKTGLGGDKDRKTGSNKQQVTSKVDKHNTGRN